MEFADYSPSVWEPFMPSNTDVLDWHLGTDGQPYDSDSSRDDDQPMPSRNKFQVSDGTELDQMRRSGCEERRFENTDYSKQTIRCSVDGCFSIFSRSTTYEQHMIAHADLDDPEYACQVPECSQIFVGKYANNKDKHYEQCHPNILRISRMNSLAVQYTHFVPSFVNGVAVSAFPDNCSKVNLVSHAFVLMHRFEFDSTDRRTIILPDSKPITTLGSIDLDFKFEGEDTVSAVHFLVLLDCVHDVILGHTFLSKTETFTRFTDRIQRNKIASHQLLPRVCLVDRPQQIVKGYLNRKRVSAFPDTGSNVNVISSRLARKLQLRVDSAFQTKLEFVDGSSTTSCGIVRDAYWKFRRRRDATGSVSQGQSSEGRSVMVGDWKFGSTASKLDSYICDFHVVKHLSSPLILGADLLYGLDAFRACSDSFSQVESLSAHQDWQIENAGVSFIRIKKELGSAGTLLRGLFASSGTNTASTTNDVTLSVITTVSSERVREDELNRRGEEADRISELPEADRPAAQAVENERIEQWDREYAQVLEVQSRPA